MRKEERKKVDTRNCAFRPVRGAHFLLSPPVALLIVGHPWKGMEDEERRGSSTSGDPDKGHIGMGALETFLGASCETDSSRAAAEVGCRRVESVRPRQALLSSPALANEVLNTIFDLWKDRRSTFFRAIRAFLTLPSGYECPWKSIELFISDVCGSSCHEDADTPALSSTVMEIQRFLQRCASVWLREERRVDEGLRPRELVPKGSEQKSNACPQDWLRRFLSLLSDSNNDDHGESSGRLWPCRHQPGRDLVRTILVLMKTLDQQLYNEGMEILLSGPLGTRPVFAPSVQLLLQCGALFSSQHWESLSEVIVGDLRNDNDQLHLPPGLSQETAHGLIEVCNTALYSGCSPRGWKDLFLAILNCGDADCDGDNRTESPLKQGLARLPPRLLSAICKCPATTNSPSTELRLAMLAFESCAASREVNSSLVDLANKSINPSDMMRTCFSWVQRLLFPFDEGHPTGRKGGRSLPGVSGLSYEGSGRFSTDRTGETVLEAFTGAGTVVVQAFNGRTDDLACCFDFVRWVLAMITRETSNTTGSAMIVVLIVVLFCEYENSREGLSSVMRDALINSYRRPDCRVFDLVCDALSIITRKVQNADNLLVTPLSSIYEVLQLPLSLHQVTVLADALARGATHRRCLHRLFCDVLLSSGQPQRWCEFECSGARDLAESRSVRGFVATVYHATESQGDMATWEVLSNILSGTERVHPRCRLLIIDELTARTRHGDLPSASKRRIQRYCVVAVALFLESEWSLHDDSPLYITDAAESSTCQECVLQAWELAIDLLFHSIEEYPLSGMALSLSRCRRRIGEFCIDLLKDDSGKFGLRTMPVSPPLAQFVSYNGDTSTDSTIVTLSFLLQYACEPIAQLNELECSRLRRTLDELSTEEVKVVDPTHLPTWLRRSRHVVGETEVQCVATGRPTCLRLRAGLLKSMSAFLCRDSERLVDRPNVSHIHGLLVLSHRVASLSTEQDVPVRRLSLRQSASVLLTCSSMTGPDTVDKARFAELVTTLDTISLVTRHQRKASWPAVQLRPSDFLMACWGCYERYFLNSKFDPLIQTLREVPDENQRPCLVLCQTQPDELAVAARAEVLAAIRDCLLIGETSDCSTDDAFIASIASMGLKLSGDLLEATRDENGWSSPFPALLLMEVLEATFKSILNEQSGPSDTGSLLLRFCQVTGDATREVFSHHSVTRSLFKKAFGLYFVDCRLTMDFVLAKSSQPHSDDRLSLPSLPGVVEECMSELETRVENFGAASRVENPDAAETTPKICSSILNFRSDAMWETAFDCAVRSIAKVIRTERQSSVGTPSTVSQASLRLEVSVHKQRLADAFDAMSLFFKPTNKAGFPSVVAYWLPEASKVLLCSLLSGSVDALCRAAKCVRSIESLSQRGPESGETDMLLDFSIIDSLGLISAWLEACSNDALSLRNGPFLWLKVELEQGRRSRHLHGVHAKESEISKQLPSIASGLESFERMLQSIHVSRAGWITPIAESLDQTITNYLKRVELRLQSDEDEPMRLKRRVHYRGQEVLSKKLRSKRAHRSRNKVVDDWLQRDRELDATESWDDDFEDLEDFVEEG